MLNISPFLRITLRLYAFVAVVVLPHTTSAMEDTDQSVVLQSEQNNILQNQQKVISNLQEENEELRSIVKDLQHIVKRISQIEQRREISLDVKEISTGESQLSVSPAYSESFRENVRDWRFSVTPRTAVRFSSVPNFTNTNSQQFSQEDATYWVNGLTISVSTPWFPNTSFLLSGLYGQDDGKRIILARAPPPNPPFAITENSTYDSELFDFEFLARTRIRDTNANWLLGFQYAKQKFDYKNQLGVFPFGRNSQLAANLFLLKAGLGGFFNLSGNGYHRVFSNFIAGGGVNRIETDEFENDTLGSVAADINIGYEWVIDQTFSLSGRYRGQFAYNFGGSDNTLINNEFVILHGPELHFTARF